MRLNGRVAEVHRTRVLAAQPPAIWAVLADFGRISEWADAIDHSCLLEQAASGPVGMSRRVQIGRETVVERISEFAAPVTLGYVIEGLPRRAGRVHVRWHLASEGSSTRVTLTNTVRIGPNPLQRLIEYVLCRAMTSKFDALLTALAQRIEAAGV
jgi:hypothetical protein